MGMRGGGIEGAGFEGDEGFNQKGKDLGWGVGDSA